MKTPILILIFATFCFQLQSKVLIFTYAFNRPDFIEIQHKTFETFIEDDYEFIVFSDANDEQTALDIKTMCAQLKLRHIPIPQEIHDRPYLPRIHGEKKDNIAVRNVTAVMYSLDLMGFNHNDILVLLDSDVFLVKPINIAALMDEYDIAGRFLSPNERESKEGKLSYLWHGMAFLNLKTMPHKRGLSFNCGRIGATSVDAGGYSHYYLRQNRHLALLQFDHLFSNEVKCSQCEEQREPTCRHNTEVLQAAGLDKNQITFLHTIHNGEADGSGFRSVEFFHNNTFLHYRAGTNWEGEQEEYHRQKTEALNVYIQTILEEKVTCNE